jgi:hypothetical protein
MAMTNEEEEGSVDASSRERSAQSVTCRKKKMGRPRKLAPDERTLGQIEGMARVGCTVQEIASALNVDKKTFFKFMADYPEAREARERGLGMSRVSLRRAQFRLATTNGQVALRLGRIYLEDQREAYLYERNKGLR